MKTAIVLLPGMDGTGELFAPLLPFLEPDIECTVVGYPDRPANYEQHVEAARRELPKDRPFVLLGESFSGPVAISLGALAPPNLLGVILCASFVTCPHRLLRLLRPLVPIATPKLVPDFIAHRALMGRFATAELRAAHARALSHVGSPTLTARLQAMADIDVRGPLRSLAVPLLYLRGGADRVVSARFGDEAVELARDGRLADIDGPHFLLQAQPRECAHHIREFIAHCARSTA